jgi:hypothetical protein
MVARQCGLHVFSMRRLYCTMSPFGLPCFTASLLKFLWSLGYCLSVCAMADTGMEMKCSRALPLVAPLSDRHAVLPAGLIFFLLGTWTASYLFSLRIRAIFHNSHIIFGAFVILWLASNALSLMALFEIRGTHIPGSQCCVVTSAYARARAGVYGVFHILRHIQP